MKNYFDKRFNRFYSKLPDNVKKQATTAFDHLVADSTYPSLHFKVVNKQYSIRIGKGYRAIGTPYNDGIKWKWIGKHDEYERRID